MIRRIVRAARFGTSLVYQATKLALMASRLPEADRPRFRAEQQRRACRIFLRHLKVHVRVVGELPEEGAFLVVANHQGLLDGWILASVLPVAFAAKSEMASWPVMGWICRVVGIIFVERDRRMAATQFVDEVQAAMRKGVRVLVFPEGTTGDGRTMLPFKTSAFEAVAGMPDGAVLPIFHRAVRVDGSESIGSCTQVAWPAPEKSKSHAWRVLGLRSVDVEVRIGAPIATAGRDRKELARMARGAMEEA